MRKGYRFQFLGYSLIFLLLSTVTCTLYPTYAAESTPSADIKAKLEELKKEIASKAAKLKQEVNQKLKDKAYIGKVIHPASGGKTKSAESLTLAATSGPKIVSLNQDTLFESKLKSRKKFSPKDILEEDFIVALGDIDETAVLTAKKVILLSPPQDEPKTHLWGQVIAMSDDLITIKNRDNEQVRASGAKNAAVSLSSAQAVKLNEFVILTGTKTKTGGAFGTEIFDAEFVYVIPQGGFIKPKKVATPSSTIKLQTATKSAKPIPKSPKLP